MAEKVAFESNVPVTVGLKYATGKPVSSQFGGEQVMYTTVDGRVMFFGEDVARRIDGLHLVAGEPFTICKQNGAGRRVEWEVGRPDVKQPAIAAPAVACAVRPNSSVVSSDPNTSRVAIDRAVTMFLVMAGRSAREAEGVLAAEGGSIHFDQRDVCALATTLLIQAARESRIGWIEPETAQQYVAEAKIRSLKAAGPVAESSPAAAEWNTRGEMRAAFSRLREAVGEKDYLRILAQFKVDDASKLHYLNDARACYAALVAIAKREAA